MGLYENTSNFYLMCQISGAFFSTCQLSNFFCEVPESRRAFRTPASAGITPGLTGSFPWRALLRLLFQTYLGRACFLHG